MSNRSNRHRRVVRPRLMREAIDVREIARELRTYPMGRGQR